MVFVFFCRNEIHSISLCPESFRNCVRFSEKYSEVVLRMCRPHLLFKLARNLFKLISQNEDVSVFFLLGSIVDFVLEEFLNQVDLSRIKILDKQSSESKCVICFEDKVQICLCPFCGKKMCLHCFEILKTLEKKFQLCPCCRSHEMFKPFQQRINRNNLILWTEILFLSIFKEHIRDFQARKGDVQSLRGSLTAFLQQNETFSYSAVMCVARWDSVGESAEVGSDFTSAMYD